MEVFGGRCGLVRLWYYHAPKNERHASMECVGRFIHDRNNFGLSVNLDSCNLVAVVPSFYLSHYFYILLLFGDDSVRFCIPQNRGKKESLG